MPRSSKSAESLPGRDKQPIWNSRSRNCSVQPFVKLVAQSSARIATFHRDETRRDKIVRANIRSLTTLAVLSKRTKKRTKICSCSVSRSLSLTEDARLSIQRWRKQPYDRSKHSVTICADFGCLGGCALFSFQSLSRRFYIWQSWIRAASRRVKVLFSLKIVKIQTCVETLKNFFCFETECVILFKKGWISPLKLVVRSFFTILSNVEY